MNRDPAAPPPPVPLAWIGDSPVYFGFPSPPGYAIPGPYGCGNGGCENRTRVTVRMKRPRSPDRRPPVAKKSA